VRLSCGKAGDAKVTDTVIHELTVTILGGDGSGPKSRVRVKWYGGLAWRCIQGSDHRKLAHPRGVRNFVP